MQNSNQSHSLSHTKINTYHFPQMSHGFWWQSDSGGVFETGKMTGGASIYCSVAHPVWEWKTQHVYLRCAQIHKAWGNMSIIVMCFTFTLYTTLSLLLWNYSCNYYVDIMNIRINMETKQKTVCIRLLYWSQ